MARKTALARFWAKLEETGWLEGWTKRERAALEKRIDACEDPARAYAALGSVSFCLEDLLANGPTEQDPPGSYHDILQRFAAGSRGAFAPRKLVDARTSLKRVRVGFELVGQRFEVVVPGDGRFDESVLALVNEALSCMEWPERFIPIPVDVETFEHVDLAFVRPEAFERAVRAGLVPPWEEASADATAALEQAEAELSRRSSSAGATRSADVEHGPIRFSSDAEARVLAFLERTPNGRWHCWGWDFEGTPVGKALGQLVFVEPPDSRATRRRLCDLILSHRDLRARVFGEMEQLQFFDPDWACGGCGAPIQNRYQWCALCKAVFPGPDLVCPACRGVVPKNAQSCPGCRSVLATRAPATAPRKKKATSKRGKKTLRKRKPRKE